MVNSKNMHLGDLLLAYEARYLRLLKTLLRKRNYDFWKGVQGDFPLILERQWNGYDIQLEIEILSICEESVYILLAIDFNPAEMDESLAVAYFSQVPHPKQSTYVDFHIINEGRLSPRQVKNLFRDE